MAGILYVVGTPIGNMGDISLRAIDILSKVNLIAAEDTRITGRLLKHYNINTKCITYNEINELYKSKDLLSKLIKGESIGLVSDAGTPCISDPGYRIVNLAKSSEIEVFTIEKKVNAN